MITYIKSAGNGFGSTAQGMTFSASLNDSVNNSVESALGLGNTEYYKSPGPTSSFNLSVKYRSNCPLWISKTSGNKWNTGTWTNALTGPANYGNASTLTLNPFIIVNNESGGFGVAMDIATNRNDASESLIGFPPSGTFSFMGSKGMAYVAGDKIYGYSMMGNGYGTVSAFNNPVLTVNFNASGSILTWNHWLVNWSGGGTYGNGYSTTSINTITGPTTQSLTLFGMTGSTPVLGNSVSIYGGSWINGYEKPSFIAAVDNYNISTGYYACTPVSSTGSTGTGFIRNWKIYFENPWMEIDEFNLIPLLRRLFTVDRTDITCDNVNITIDKLDG